MAYKKFKIMDKFYIELKGTIIAICIWAIACALTEIVKLFDLPNYCIALTFLVSFVILQIVFFRKYY